MIDTADDHRELARWCRKNKLKDEERIHWIKVLEFDRNDEESLSALGLQFYNGRLMTRGEMKLEKEKAGEQLQALRNWQPKIVKWSNAIESFPAKRDEAIRQLEAISDPSALGALTATVASHQSAKSTESDQFLIEAIGRVPNAEATRDLVRIALFLESPETRKSAVRELKKRPLYAFVPTLLQMWNGPTSTRFEISILPNGAVLHDHWILQEDAFGRGNSVTIFEARVPASGTRNNSMIVQRGFERAQLEAAQIEQAAALNKERKQLLNQRIQDILAQTTDFAISDDPQALLQQWIRHTDTYAPPLLAAPAQQRQFYGVVRPLSSCFPPGTLILTISGSTPIERIKCGDRVLAQNPETGELAFKTVQGVTLRPPASMIRIGTGSQSITSTRGHPFWVNGRGWLMAKQLEVGMLLHSLNGALVVDSLEEARASEAYNLVVSDFDTYFVGDQQILVHDNLPLEETTALVPGLSRSDAD